MKVYNKLVRDKIPQIIESQGKQAEYRVLSDIEYKAMLDQKLHEEFLEYTHSNEEDQVEELADLVEVVYGILESKGVSVEEFEKVRLAKKEERGGFKDKLFLVSVREPFHFDSVTLFNKEFILSINNFQFKIFCRDGNNIVINPITAHAQTSCFEDFKELKRLEKVFKENSVNLYDSLKNHNSFKLPFITDDNSTYKKNNISVFL